MFGFGRCSKSGRPPYPAYEGYSRIFAFPAVAHTRGGKRLTTYKDSDALHRTQTAYVTTRAQVEWSPEHGCMYSHVGCAPRRRHVRTRVGEAAEKNRQK